MKLHNDTLELTNVLRSLKKHLDALELEPQPLTAEEIKLLRQLEATLPMEISWATKQLMPSIVRLLKRSRNSKKSEDSAGLNFPLPKSSEAKSAVVEAKQAGAQVMIQELIRLLQALMLAREQRRRPPVVPVCDME